MDKALLDLDFLLEGITEDPEYPYEEYKRFMASPASAGFHITVKNPQYQTDPRYFSAATGPSGISPYLRKRGNEMTYEEWITWESPSKKKIGHGIIRRRGYSKTDFPL